MPTLIGRNLRNYLAHNDVLTNTLSIEASVDVHLNAIKLTDENGIQNGRQIDQVVNNDPDELEHYYEENLKKMKLQTDLFKALKEGNIEGVRKSLESGSDLNARSMDSWTALHFASASPNLEVVKYILERNMDTGFKNIYGQNALHVAAVWEDTVQ
ncbi:ankyrin-1 [Caerostris extrusa]|uniref:Ankyrin-1 n=1 Tax=Caerostris extrusa TaxID=172846 RepID=A0AAV4MKM1_CAEEX|nr:ankyrin-1 [Caerostris extrusa]